MIRYFIELYHNPRSTSHMIRLGKLSDLCSLRWTMRFHVSRDTCPTATLDSWIMHLIALWELSLHAARVAWYGIPLWILQGTSTIQWSYSWIFQDSLCIYTPFPGSVNNILTIQTLFTLDAPGHQINDCIILVSEHGYRCPQKFIGGDSTNTEIIILESHRTTVSTDSLQ